MEKYFEATYIIEAIPLLLPFLKVTFLVTALSVLLGTLLGLLLAVMKLSKRKIYQRVAHGYTTIMRCTPSIVLLFLVYYGLPALAKNFHVDLNNLHTAVFVIITFTLQFGAIMSEVIRAAYESVDKGQYEAAVSVGLTNAQAIRRIVFPQAFAVALPNFGNGLLELMKEGALAYTIGLIDVMGKAHLMIASNMNAHALEIFIALSLIYWVLSIIIEQTFTKFERLCSKGKQVIKTT